MNAAPQVEETPGAELPGFFPPQQRRSRETLDDLVEAVGALLVESGTADATVRDIVARAGTSVGAFYARFDNRDVALAFSCLDFWARSRRMWSEYLAAPRWREVPSTAMVTSVVRTTTWVMVSDADRLRAWLSMSLSVPHGRIARRIGEHDRFVASAFADALMVTAGEARHRDPRGAAEAGFRRVLASVRDQILFDLPVQGVDRTAATRDLVLCLAQMLTQYLDVHPVPSSYQDVLEQARGAPPPPPLPARTFTDPTDPSR